MAWTFASVYQDKEAEKMDNFIKKKFNNVEFPSENIINCFINTDYNYFESLQSKVPFFEYEKSMSFWDIMVPTIDTIKFEYIIGLHLEKQRNVYLTGNSGTGKSSLAHKCLQKFS